MADKPLSGKVALVTGSFRNLGAVTSETLASYGANVIINDLNTPELARIGEKVLGRIRSNGVQAAVIPADLNNTVELRKMCQDAQDAFGRVDILVNNAGPFSMDPFLAMSEETWDLVMNVNLKAIYLTAQELAPGMKANGWGRIINMSAGSAYVRNHNVYTLAKFGVQVITESLALELGPEITVNAIAPGQIYESLPDIAEFDPTFGERYTARSPLKRLITRSEIANLIVQFCLPTHQSVTGVTIKADAGAEIWRF
jgi:NAD(P)-dependent dehydrogenase (short-subunit alcohol dehydrogenase family)